MRPQSTHARGVVCRRAKPASRFTYSTLRHNHTSTLEMKPRVRKLGAYFETLGRGYNDEPQGPKVLDVASTDAFAAVSRGHVTSMHVRRSVMTSLTIHHVSQLINHQQRLQTAAPHCKQRIYHTISTFEPSQNSARPVSSQILQPSQCPPTSNKPVSSVATRNT